MSSQPHSMYIAATRLQIEQTIFSVAQSGEEAGQSTRLLDLITRIPVSDRPQILEDHVVWYIALNWGWFRHPDAVVTLINFARCNASYPGQPQLREQLETALATCLKKIEQLDPAATFEDKNPNVNPRHGAVRLNRDDMSIHWCHFAARLLKQDYNMDDAFFVYVMASAFEGADLGSTPDYEIYVSIPIITDWLENCQDIILNRIQSKTTSHELYNCGEMYQVAMNCTDKAPLDRTRWNRWRDRFIGLGGSAEKMREAVE